MRNRFDEKKTTQAAARFLLLAGGELNYMVLIKLLYLLDREALLSWGRPVSYDDFYSMQWGPVLSSVHDLITEPPAPHGETFWNKVISNPSDYKVSLQNPADVDAGELSQAEEELIARIFTEYGKYKDQPFELCELLHNTLPEWKRVRRGERIAIQLSEILNAGHMPVEDIRAIEDELDSLGTIKAFA